MEDPNHENLPTVKTGQFRLSQAMAQKISAVDGKAFTARMRTVVESANYQMLTPDQRRALIKETLRRK